MSAIGSEAVNHCDTLAWETHSEDYKHGAGFFVPANDAPWDEERLTSQDVTDTFAELFPFRGMPQQEYNTQRPHSSLGYLTPAGFGVACAACVWA